MESGLVFDGHYLENDNAKKKMYRSSVATTFA
jgi:hypothetical protein